MTKNHKKSAHRAIQASLSAEDPVVSHCRPRGVWFAEKSRLGIEGRRWPRSTFLNESEDSCNPFPYADLDKGQFFTVERAQASYDSRAGFGRTEKPYGIQ